jgi:hypothetical protein
MRVWADDLLMPDNIDTWNQFIDQFKAEYADSQKPERARSEIEKIVLKGTNIDQYITDCISLASDANYHLEADGTKRAFLRGFPRYTAGEVTRRLTTPYTWP